MPQERDEKWAPLVTAEAVSAERVAVLEEEIRILTFQRNDALELAGRYYTRLTQVEQAVRAAYGLDLDAIVRGVK